MRTGRQTGRHDEANSHFSQFYERAKNLKIENLLFEGGNSEIYNNTET